MFQLIEQGTTRVEVNIYPPATGIQENSGIPNLTKKDFTVIQCSTSKFMGQPSGTFALTVKSRLPLMRYIPVNSWIDIAFVCPRGSYPTLRGLVDTITETESAQSGATERVFTLEGRDFGKIFEDSLITFDVLKEGKDLVLAFYTNLAAVGNRSAVHIVGKTPVEMIELLTRSFLNQESSSAVGLWDIPPQVPLSSVAEGDKGRLFSEQLQIANDDAVTGYPKRFFVRFPHYYVTQPTGLWQILQEYGDQALLELYCDLTDGSSVSARDSNLLTSTGNSSTYQYLSDEPISFDKVNMSLILRNRPFESADPDWNPEGVAAPRWRIHRFDVASKTLGKTDAARRNVFIASGMIAGGLTDSFLYKKPVYDPVSVKAHGLRQETVSSAYLPVSTKQDAFGQALKYLQIYRDFHCLNHEKESGTINLRTVAPWMRIGSWLEIAGGADAEADPYLCYIEGVTHSWSYEKGAQTQLTVTQGYSGGLDKYRERLRKVASRYKSPGVT